ncbi:MAG: hypothetical protein AAFX46_13440, partial [Cyanobacteria bacterium J06636_27]
LKFPLVIVYKKGSESAEKFIEIMQTDEGKDLLKEAGFTPTNSKKTMTKKPQINQKIQKILSDDILLQKLSDKVYKLMLEEIQNERDRNPNYRR